jgi:hypothetical protein
MSRPLRAALLCLALAAALVAPLLFRSASPNSAESRTAAEPASFTPALSLFSQPAAPQTAAATSPASYPEFYRRTRPLQLAPAIAAAATRDPAAQIGQRWRFELFDDIAWDGLVTRAETVGPGRVNLYGELEGVPGSDFIVTLNGVEAAAMSFTTPGAPGRYQVRTAAPGHLLAIELAPELLPPCAHDHHTAAPHDPALAQQARQHAALLAQHAADLNLPGSSYGAFGQQGGSADGLSFTDVDVMIAYTAAAQTGAGGEAGVIALADHMVARANATFINSRVGLRLRLVHLQSVSYSEPGNIFTDLNRLTDIDDGHLDDIHATRTNVGADLVTLLVEDAGPSAAGLAWLYDGTGNDAAYGFNVVERAGCESTYVHEVGHNLGCQHDRENTSSNPPYPYAYGHRFTPAGYGQLRTVMAYWPGDRIPYFSNPDVTYLGAPTGVPIGQIGQAHNAQVLNNTKAAIAAFRATAGNQPPLVTLTSPAYDDSLVALQDITLAANATDPDGTIASVRFYRLSADSSWNFSNVNSTSLGVDTLAPYEHTVADAPAGYVTYAAVATDNQGDISTDTVSVTINPWYRQELLPLPEGYDDDFDVVAINSAGQIAGTSYSEDNYWRATRWTGANPTILLPLPGDVDSVGLAIGEDGTVYGTSYNPDLVGRAVRWSPAGTVTDLSSAVPGQTMVAALGQDEIGRSLYARSNDRGHRDTVALPGNFLVEGIASSGIVAGTDFSSAADAKRAARWDSGAASTLLAPQGGFLSSWGWAINRSGAVAGDSAPQNDRWSSEFSRATYWPAGSTTAVDIAPILAPSTTESINDHDEIVGYFGSSFSSPFLWRPGLGAINLEHVVLPTPGASLERAKAINNRGMIAVESWDGMGFVPVRLIPVGGLSHRHWASTHFSLAELDTNLLAGDDDDPDGDGLPNLIERAFNLNPRVAEASYSSTGYPALGFDEVAQKLTLTFRRLRAPSDVTYTVEATSNLASSWSSAGAVEVSRTALDADWDEVVYQSVATPASGTPVFLRVRVGR